VKVGRDDTCATDADLGELYVTAGGASIAFGNTGCAVVAVAVPDAKGTKALDDV